METILGSGRHHHLIGLGIFLIVIPLVVGLVGCGPISIEIRDWSDLDAIRDNMRGSYILMNDLDFTTAGYVELASPTADEGKGWQPIGSIGANDAFAGSFDGQGYEIRDLFINRPDESAVGIFGVVEAGGVIENIGVVNSNVTGYENVGSLAGYSRGTVSNSYACDNVAGDLDVGSLVGVNDGTVSNSYASGSVIGRDGVGGLVGRNEGTMSNSYSSGTVNGSNSVGGLVGRNEGTVSKCYSTGNVTGDEHVGGLVAQNLYGVVSKSFWDIETSGQATSDGGTGKTTEEMQDIATFSGADWNIIGVDDADDRNDAYTWNTVDGDTYPFLSWQPAV